MLFRVGIGLTPRPAIQGTPMTYRGTVRKGKVELEPGADLPEGATVAVHPIAPPASVYRLYDLALSAAADDGLPADFAAETDHYLYGTPRRKPAAASKKNQARPSRKRSAATPVPKPSLNKSPAARKRRR
jgi:hypothetical protein